MTISVILHCFPIEVLTVLFCRRFAVLLIFSDYVTEVTQSGKLDYRLDSHGKPVATPASLKLVQCDTPHYLLPLQRAYSLVTLQEN